VAPETLSRVALGLERLAITMPIPAKASAAANALAAARRRRIARALLARRALNSDARSSTPGMMTLSRVLAQARFEHQ
jgi:hypothetical protein